MCLQSADRQILELFVVRVHQEVPLTDLYASGCSFVYGCDSEKEGKKCYGEVRNVGGMGVNF